MGRNIFIITGVVTAQAPSSTSEMFQAQVRSLVLATVCQNSHDSLKSMLTDHFQTPGKMIRPHLVYHLGHLQHADLDQLAAWAASCELLHNATLIHDDLQDRDAVRRGRPSLWAKFGEKQAINAGDFLLLAALQPVLESNIDSLTKNKLLLNFSQMACRIVNGQNLEFELNETNLKDGIYEKYVRCISLKTAALFSDLARGVNLLTAKPFASDEYVKELFDRIGILYQMLDDVIDLYGEKQRDGRGCDIKEGKVSFLFATHVQHSPADFSLIMPILRKPRELTTDEDVEYLSELYLTKGTVSQCLAEINNLKKEIQQLSSQSGSKNLQDIVNNLMTVITSQPLLKELK